MLAAPTGEVVLEVAFSREESGRTRVAGAVSVCASLVCQNCMQPFIRRLDCALDLVIVADERALSELAPEINGVIHADRVSLVDLLEDDLILAVPMIPRHEEHDCPGNDYAQQGAANGGMSPGGGEVRRRPFAGLAEALAAGKTGKLETDKLETDKWATEN